MNRSSPDRFPSWNTQTSTPSDAASESKLVSSALIGITTEPVMRNSSTNVAKITIPAAHGSPSMSAVAKSSWPAAWPVTQVGKPGSTPRTASTVSWATLPPASVVSGRTPIMTLDPIAIGGSTDATESSAARSVAKVPAFANVVSATTMTAGDVAAG